MCNVHLGVEDAGGGLDDCSQTVVSLDLEDLALGVSDDGQKADHNILRLHVQNERERQRLSLASRNLDVVLDRRKVAKDTGHRGRILRQWLCGRKRSTDEGKLNGLVLMVRDLDDRLSRVPVDKLDTKARVGEMRGDIDLQVGNFRSGIRRGLRILWLQLAQHVRIMGLLGTWSRAAQSKAEGGMAALHGSRATRKKVDLHRPRRRRRPRHEEPEEQGSRA